MAPVAERLGRLLEAIEPFQRPSGGEPLTVARHVEDLHALIQAEGRPEPPAILGSSWGAMLALAYAAAHPAEAGPLILVGCGTVDRAARARLEELREARTTPQIRAALARAGAIADRGEALKAQVAAGEPVDTLDPLPGLPPVGEAVDVRALEETWADMVRLQDAGVYPAAFAAIRSPVLMLHGDYDPHPGRMIRDSLLPVLPQLEYRELERCGHMPWRERAAAEPFYAAVLDWLERTKPGSIAGRGG
jgi:pimeloyl-ACP methyl ester carboxylesterase